MQKKYFLSFNGSHIGPFGVDSILKRLHTAESQWTDYLYDDAVGEWVMLLEHPEFSGKNIPVKASQSPVAEMTDLKEKEWFMLKDGNNYGPFSKLELLQMLQAKNAYEFDYVWSQGMSSWKRIAELAEFAPEKVRELAKSDKPEISEVFFRRRHARAKYGASLIVHNSQSVYKGKTLEISAGGAGVQVECADLQPGQTLFLHFQPGDGVPPFNAVCQIVSKQFSKDSSSPNSARYGVKFTTITQFVRESIRTYTSKAA